MLMSTLNKNEIESALAGLYEQKGISVDQISGSNESQFDSPQLLAQITTIKEKLDGAQLNNIEIFGCDLGITTDHYLNNMLTHLNNPELEKLGAKLTKLMLKTREHTDTATIYCGRKKSRIPIIGKLIDQYFERQQTNKLIFDYAKKNIEHFFTEIVLNRAVIQESNHALSVEYHGISNMAEQMGLHLIAAQARLNEIKSKIRQLQFENYSKNSKALSQQIESLNKSITPLDQRIENIYLLHQASVLVLEKIDSIQHSNLTIMNRLDVVKDKILPTWLNNYATAIGLNDQPNKPQYSVNALKGSQKFLANEVGEILKIQTQNLQDHLALITCLRKTKVFAAELEVKPQKDKCATEVKN